MDSIYSYLREKDTNPVCVIPTGGGKTPCIASICKDAITQWDGRVVIVSHIRELLEQSYSHIIKTDPSLEKHIGIYSAGLKKKQTEQSIILAGVQSVYKKACDIGARDIIIADECHRIPPDGEGMWRTFIEEMKVIRPHCRVIGFTATPYRLQGGMICSPENILNEIAFSIGIKELIAQGFLSPLISKAGGKKADLSSLHVRGGEYIASEVEALFDTDPLVLAACTEILEYTENRKACLIFASGVAHGKHICEVLRSRGANAETIFGETPSTERDGIIKRFKAGEIKYLVNVAVLCEGFDAPHVDAIALLRPTLSAGLYYQQVGRGFRLSPQKADCLVLDFANLVHTHGPVDQIEVKPAKAKPEEPGEPPGKECPECQGLMAAGCSTCPYCGFAFPPRELKHEPTASMAGILSGQNRTEVRQVYEVRYSKHANRKEPEKPPTMRVEYVTSTGVLRDSVSEWICIEHEGWARQKAAAWWSMRSVVACPASVDAAVALANAGALATCEAVTVAIIAGEKWPKLVGYKLGARPEYSNADAGWATFEEIAEFEAKATPEPAKDNAADMIKAEVERLSKPYGAMSIHQLMADSVFIQGKHGHNCRGNERKRCEGCLLDKQATATNTVNRLLKSESLEPAKEPEPATEAVTLFNGSTVQRRTQAEVGHFDEEGRWQAPKEAKPKRRPGDMEGLPW